MLPMESPTLGKLAEALAKAQGAMNPAKKDSTNPHFKSQYADLASCWAAIREPLAANGLALIQRVSTDNSGVTVESLLVHVSGEYVRNNCWMPVAQKTPIAYGSAITYARRYSLSALTGLSAEDDDGSAASSPAPQRQVTGMKQVPPPPKAEESPASDMPIVPSGKYRGKPLPTVPTEAVTQMREQAMAALADEAKTQFHAAARQWLQQVELELEKRKTT